MNQNDIDNLKLAIDKMKMSGEPWGFDAAQKMETLLAAYEKQDEDDGELEQLQDVVESLPGWSKGVNRLKHVEDTAAMLERALDNVQEWSDSKGDEPLDDAVARLVAQADGPNAEAEKLAKVLDRIVAVVDRGDSDALDQVRKLAMKVL